MANNDSTWLVVGLGNPGAKYEKSRHNIGFMVVDAYAASQHGTWRNEKCQAQGCKVPGPKGSTLLLLKPQTFMNLSGQAVGEAARFYQINPDHVIVIHDEMDVPVGQLKLKIGGGAAGHNGIKSVAEHIGADFYRIRVGIGKAPGVGADFVLGDFNSQERPIIDEMRIVAMQAVDSLITNGLAPTQNHFHSQNLAK